MPVEVDLSLRVGTQPAIDHDRVASCVATLAGRLVGDLGLGKELVVRVEAATDGALPAWEPVAISLGGEWVPVRFGVPVARLETTDVITRCADGLFLSRERLVEHAIPALRDALDAPATAPLAEAARPMARDAIAVGDGLRAGWAALRAGGEPEEVAADQAARLMAPALRVHLGESAWHFAADLAGGDIGNGDLGELGPIVDSYREALAGERFDLLPVEFVRDLDLEPDESCLGLNAVRLAPLPVPGHGEAFVNDIPETLALYGIEGRAALSPEAYGAGTIVAAADLDGDAWRREIVRYHGITYALLASQRHVLAHSSVLLSRERVALLLRSLADFHGAAALVGLAIGRLGIERMTGQLRALLDAGASMANLRAILAAALQVTGDAGATRDAPDDIARLRRSLRHSLLARSPGEGWRCYLLDPGFERWIGAQQDDIAARRRIAAAIAAVHHPGGGFEPVVLVVADALRAQVTAAIEAALPEVKVFSASEMGTSHQVEYLGIIPGPADG